MDGGLPRRPGRPKGTGGPQVLARMNTPVGSGPVAEVDRDLLREEGERWLMKGLKPMHKQVASLLAQGLRNVDIARMVGITPEYVSILSRQPMVQQYVYEMVAVAGLQLEATFPLVVKTIQETLADGTEAGKLKAARLHLEATKRIGRTELPTRPVEESLDRLTKLGERLLALQSRADGYRAGGTFTQAGESIEDVPGEGPSSGEII